MDTLRKAFKNHIYPMKQQAQALRWTKEVLNLVTTPFPLHCGEQTKRTR